jgi:hypothetical protein
MPPEATRDPIDPASEARQLVVLFTALSQALTDFRLSDVLPPDTPPPELKRIKKAAEDMEDLANHFEAEAIGATLLAIQPDLAKIKQVTADAKTQLGHLNTVSKGISIATAGLSLGTAIVTGNPLSIGKALEEFGKAVAA